MVVTTQIVKKEKEKGRKKMTKEKKRTNEGRENTASYSTRESYACTHAEGIAL
jgi:hypothetical protein